MVFCHVVDGKIKQGPALRPKWWNGIQGFDELTEDQAISYGWLPYRLVDSPGADEIKINEITEIKEREVVCTHVYRPMTQEEIEERERVRWGHIRGHRTQLLRDSDWTQIPDAPLSSGDKLAWATYRQALRDLPATQTDPDNIVWPQSPDEGIKTATL